MKKSDYKIILYIMCSLLVSLLYLIAQCTVMDYLKSLQNLRCSGILFLLNVIIRVNLSNTDTLTYKQHEFLISVY